MDPNTPQPSSGSALGTPLPESVTNALMSIQPRYNSFHQHHAMPHMTSGNSYNPSPGQAPGSVPGTTSNSNNNNNLQPATTSVINLSNSSDVVIGPMTQYQGSVTIYQYMDATVEATRIACKYLISTTDWRWSAQAGFGSRIRTGQWNLSASWLTPEWSGKYFVRFRLRLQYVRDSKLAFQKDCCARCCYIRSMWDT